jgi:hypothetical protein
MSDFERQPRLLFGLEPADWLFLSSGVALAAAITALVLIF